MMALQPDLSLSPLNPKTYHYGSPSAHTGSPAEVYAYLDAFGVSLHRHSYTLPYQYKHDEIVFSSDPVGLNDQTIQSFENDCFRRSGLLVQIHGYYMDTQNLYLLLFALRRVQGNPSAQFFIGTDLVRTEALSGFKRVGILMDVPSPDHSIYIFVRLASPNYTDAMGFLGVDCYLL